MMDTETELIVRDLMLRLDIIDSGKLRKGFSRIQFDFSDSDLIIRVKEFGPKHEEDDFNYPCICGIVDSPFLIEGFSLYWYCGKNECLEQISRWQAVQWDLHKTAKFQQLLGRAIKWAQK